MSTLLDAALALHAAGLCVLPAAEDASKRPAVDWKTYQANRPDEAQLRSWFDDGRRTGLGVVCGAVSGGLELCELEGRAVQAGALTDLAELATNSGLGDLWAKVTAGGYVVRSPSGGVHLLYRLTGVAVPGNTKLAALHDHTTLAETRGEGGWVVTAPSHGRVHPTGGAWAVVLGSPATIPTLDADERHALHVLVAQLDQRPQPAPASVFTAHSSGRTDDGISPGDDYAARTTWAQVLEPAGWRHLFDRGPVGHWRRPGKNDGISATTGFGEGDWLYVFTSSTALEPQRTYTKFGAYAALQHDGDHQAAAKALQADGLGRAATRHNPTSTRHLSAVPDTPRTDGANALAPDPAPVPAPQGGYTLTDSGNAELLVATFGDRIRYVPERGMWLRWAGHRWAEDTVGEHMQHAKATLTAAIDGTPTDQKAVHKHLQASLSRRGLEAMVALARTDPAVVAPAATLDAHRHLLCTPGGTVDLHTGQLAPADPGQLHTRATAVTPDPTTPTPRWDAFLTDTFRGDTELVAYMQRLAGYAATGSVTAHVLPFLLGPGGNGKGVLTEVLLTLLADYATTAPGTFLTAGRDQHETEIARLHGMRLVVASEVDQGARFAEAKVKLLTGGDILTARFMRRDHFTFVPSHKLWLMANHQPQVAAGGASFWRRLRLVPFRHQVPDERRVDGLADLLVTEEGPGILAWVMAGTRAFYAGGLADPPRVLADTATYAEEEDALGRFVAERLVVADSPAASVLELDSRVVRAEYARWCHDEGVDELDAAQFGRELRARFGIGQRRSNGRRFYLGVSLLADDDRPTWTQPAPAGLFTPHTGGTTR